MLIKVKVFPNSKKEKIVQKSKNSFEISVKDKPLKGMANRSVIKALVSYLNISRKDIQLIKGVRQRNKIFKIIN